MKQKLIDPCAILCIGIAVAFVLLAPGRTFAQHDAPRGASQSDGSVSPESQRERAEELLDALKSDEKEEALRAETELLQMGRSVIPVIQKKLKSSDAGVYYQLLKQMESLYSGPITSGENSGSGRNPLEELSVEEELHSIENWTEKKEAPENEKVFVGRYRDALKKYKSGQPRKAMQIAKAILIVAPGVSFAKKVKDFIRKCRERLFNENVLRASVTTEKVRYAWDEEIQLSYRVKNVSENTVTIYFDMPRNARPGAGTGGARKEGENDGTGRTENQDQTRDVRESPEESSSKTVVLEVNHEKIGITGDSVTETRYREHSVPAWVAIPPGKAWVRTVTLDTSMFEHRYVLRRITLSARTIPSFLEMDEKRVNRWIVFEKARFELYPRGMRESLPATIPKIRQHLRAGNMRDVFFLTFLLPSNRHEKLIKQFIRVLPFLKRRSARTIMFLLQELTGQNFYYNRDRWLEWGRDEYDVDVEPPDRDQKRTPLPVFDE